MANEKKWTGGEWRARSFNDDPFKVWEGVSKRGQLADKHDVAVCDVYSGVKPEIAEANAHLLAASKRLFEALRIAKEGMEQAKKAYGIADADWDMSIATSEAVLSAALGEKE